MSSVFAFKINPTTFPPSRFGDIASFLNIIIPLIFIVAAIILLAMLFMGGYTLITAGGNPEKTQKAQKIFGFAIFGFIIIILSYLITKIIGIILKVDIPI